MAADQPRQSPSEYLRRALGVLGVFRGFDDAGGDTLDRLDFSGIVGDLDLGIVQHLIIRLGAEMEILGFGQQQELLPFRIWIGRTSGKRQRACEQNRSPQAAGHSKTLWLGDVVSVRILHGTG